MTPERDEQVPGRKYFEQLYLQNAMGYGAWTCVGKSRKTADSSDLQLWGDTLIGFVTMKFLKVEKIWKM